MVRRSTIESVSVLLGLAYVYGLIFGGLSLGWQLMFSRELPTLAWWQWLAAPLAVGLVALAGEWLFGRVLLSSRSRLSGARGEAWRLFFGITVVVLLLLFGGGVLYMSRGS